MCLINTDKPLPNLIAIVPKCFCIFLNFLIFIYRPFFNSLEWKILIKILKYIIDTGSYMIHFSTAIKFIKTVFRLSFSMYSSSFSILHSFSYCIIFFSLHLYIPTWNYHNYSPSPLWTQLILHQIFLILLHIFFYLNKITSASIASANWS